VLRALIQSSPPDEALAWTEHAIPLFELIGDGLGVAALRHLLAREYRLRGLLEEAEAENARAAELFAANSVCKSQRYLPFLNERVWLRIEQSRYEEGLADITEGAAIGKALGDQGAVRWAINRAELEFAMGHTEVAIGIAEDVTEHANKSEGDRAFWSSGAYASIACYRAANGDLREAFVAARKSLALSRSGQRPTVEPIFVMALIAASRGDTSIAARILGAIETLERTRQIGPSASMIAGGCGAVRQLLIASLNQQLPPQKLANLKADGASFAWDITIAEALKVSIDV
jgi:tetratricopeptide (TPR) repeat protein